MTTTFIITIVYGKELYTTLKNVSYNEDGTSNEYLGAFVNYDDSPRRSTRGKVIKGASPIKFKKYLSKLISISKKQNKEFIFLTAWNEWGEGAYLEPDTANSYDYLKVIKELTD